MYKKWLDRKASAHYKRDGNRYSKEEYKQAIHKAVVLSAGYDFYTGEWLEWEKLSSFGSNGNYNKEPKLPTVDHLNGRSEIDLLFVITGWAVNDAKNDHTYEDFLDLCQKILDHKEKCMTDFKKFEKNQ